MKKVAVFGNAGGGKSTLARRLAEITSLSVYSVDMLQFRPGGEPVAHDEYLKIHAEILDRERWIIDGYGCLPSALSRFEAADTLIYIDLPLSTHFWWVTKRFAKGLFVTPEGWPQGSPLWSSTLAGYRVIFDCHRWLTPKYRQLVADKAASKRVHHLRSPTEMKAFLRQARQEQQQY